MRTPLHKHKHKNNEHVRSSYAYAYVTVFTNENGDDKARAQGSQPYRPPSCLISRGADVENSVKKWFSARASVLMLMFSLAFLYDHAYVLVKTSL